MKIIYKGKLYVVLREIEGYYTCKLDNCEMELIVKKSDATLVEEDTLS